MTKYERIAELFVTLSSPLRIHIIELLSRQEYSPGEIAKTLGKQHATISTSIRSLRSHGLVACTREKNRAIYRLERNNELVKLTLSLLKEQRQ